MLLRAPNAKEETGNTHGRLTVLGRTMPIPKGHNGKPIAMWHCRCSCGNECSVWGRDLRSGKTRSCGCLLAETSSKRMTKDLNGMVFGSLTVISRAASKNHIACWNVECVCGAEIVVDSQALVGTHRKRCGNDCPVYLEARAINTQMKTYKQGAKERKLSWELSPEQFIQLINGDCFFCGAPPAQRQGYYRLVFTSNGIDRLDSSKGYTSDNCVTACKMCNVAKSNHSVDKFLGWSLAVFKRNIRTYITLGLISEEAAAGIESWLENNRGYGATVNA